MTRPPQQSAEAPITDELVPVWIGIGRPALRFGPVLAAPDGSRHRHAPYHGADAMVTLASLEVWLRSSSGRRFPMRRSAQPTGTATAAWFSASVPPGQYVVCAGPIEAPLRFPARSISVEAGDTPTAMFRLLDHDRPYFRMGAALVPFGGAGERLAAVLHHLDLDSAAVERLDTTLRAHGFERVIDLTALQRSMTAEVAVLEFAAVVPGSHGTPSLDELIPRTAAIAAAAGVPASLLRLGRLVRSDHGTVVVDNELVLGFSRDISAHDAERHVRAAGGRVVEQLSSRAEPGPILLSSFAGVATSAALTLTESWLDQGLLHWVEPNLVEF